MLIQDPGAANVHREAGNEKACGSNRNRVVGGFILRKRVFNIGVNHRPVTL